MEFITSNKGARKLCYAGYAYTKKKQSKTTIRWECCQRKSSQCKGALTTDSAATEVKSMTDHNHEADRFAIAAMKVKSEIKATVEANRGKPGQIIADKLATVPKEVASAAGRVDSLKRQVRRVKKGTAPPEPASICDIPNPLPEPYTTMSRGGSFLIYDNGSTQQRVLVFASDDGLDLLGDADTWFMDGTHSTAPAQFPQLFCIRVPLGQSCVSAAYALLPSKLQVHYEECLIAIQDACFQRDIRPNPTRIVADYEVAIHNAVRSIISTNINIQGCFYHLTQSTWRRVQQEGLQAVYKSDPEVRIFCGMLDALAFLPVDRVPDRMRALREAAPDHLASLVDYFDGTYVSGHYRAVVSEGVECGSGERIQGLHLKLGMFKRRR